MTRISIALVASTLAFASPAYADWAGGYGGALLSYSGGEAQDFTFGPGSFDVDGFEGGLFGGYNFQTGNIVYGVEASILASSASGDDGAFQTPFEVNSALTAMARVGYDAGTFLPWVGVGAQVATVDSTHGPGSTEILGSSFTGAVLALGVDYAISDSMFVRGSFETVDYGTIAQGFFSGTDIHNTSYSTNRITVGVGFSF